MKKTFELLGNEISNHFDDPLLSNRITKALNDAYEDGRNGRAETAQLAPEPESRAKVDVKKLRSLLELTYEYGQQYPDTDVGYLFGWGEILKRFSELVETPHPSLYAGA